ncbi:60s ribosomal protein l34 [Stylonychia lemnae]|uniref:60s ribosomal protein l34 n=1 Tax=Stylonychia lemnae TaxID=5949 RepID=A0A078ARQ1_STYLE|nr:60s ribosomal protein l34 [Stylonychia lemnae]|eukprot:CDW83538.1 60s ribosomal protein l34 [Stylonychia lemnae]
MLERRVHYRRQNHYRTKSNGYKIVKTPGGKLTIHYLKRSAGKTVAGIPKLRSPALSRLTVTKRTVSRAYGGKLTHAEVRDKIVRAFLIEEVKQMKRLMQQKDKSSKKSKKNKSKGKKK